MEPSLLHIDQIHPILRLDETALRSTVERMLSREGKPIKYLGIILTDHGTVRELNKVCLLYTSPSPRDRTRSRMPSSA